MTEQTYAICTVGKGRAFNLAAWPNGKASDYDYRFFRTREKAAVINQEIVGSSPIVVTFWFG